MSEIFYAVYQDGYGIFGIGSTESEAIEDAKQWVDEPDNLESEIESAQGFVGDMKIVRVSNDVKLAVENHGGNIGISKDDAGVYQLDSDN